MRITRHLTAAAAVATTTLALAGTASAKTVTQTASAPLASGGTVNASLSYTPIPSEGADKAISLTISRDGQTLLSGPLAAKGCPSDCEVSQGNGGQAVHVTDLQGNGEPVVSVDLFTGGAHCCGVTEFFTYSATTQKYTQIDHQWGDPGYTLLKLNGSEVFETANDAFAYEFTDYAASGLPLQLLSFNGTGFTDVTRHYPSRIIKDAALWFKAFQSQASDKYQDTTGLIAAWAADEDELGNSAKVASYLKRQAALKHLNSGLPGEPGNARFITALNRFLKRQGYLK